MKTRVSATVDRARLTRAQELTGCANTSSVLDQALELLIVAHLERAHVQGYARRPQGVETISAPDSSVWADIPWDEDDAQPCAVAKAGMPTFPKTNGGQLSY